MGDGTPHKHIAGTTGKNHTNKDVLLDHLDVLLGEHPFNLKGGGGAYGFFWEKKILSANLIEKKFCL